MNYYQPFLLAVASFILCSSCGEGIPESTEVSYPQAEAAVTTDTSRQQASVTGVQIEAQSSSDLAVTCEEKEEKSPELEDPLIVKSCTYGNYKTVLTGSPDYKGRYYWEYQLYKAKNGEYTAVSNSALFNQRQRELQGMINKKIKADHLELLENSETAECLEMREPIRDFLLDEMGISFEPDQIVFHVEFGLPDACRNVDGIWVSFKLEEVEPYLKE